MIECFVKNNTTLDTVNYLTHYKSIYTTIIYDIEKVLRDGLMIRENSDLWYVASLKQN